MMCSWMIYILELSNGIFYTGITNNLEKRMKKHADRKGSKLVRAHLPFKLVYVEKAKDRSEASKRECIIKKLNREEKETLVQTNKKDKLQVEKIYMSKEVWEDILKNDKQLEEKKMSNFPIQPLFDKVFVKKDDAKKDKDDVFFLPDSVKGRAQTGTIVAIGPGYLDLVTGKFIPTTLKAGDRVFIREFDGYIIKYGEHEFFIFNEKDIVGKLVEGQ